LPPEMNPVIQANRLVRQSFEKHKQVAVQDEEPNEIRVTHV